MRALAWVLLLVSLVVWSLLALGAHGLVGWAGDMMLRQADFFTGHAETVAWIGWAVALANDLGGWIVVAIWGLGVLGMIVGFWLLRRWSASRRGDARPVAVWRKKRDAW